MRRFDWRDLLPRERRDGSEEQGVRLAVPSRGRLHEPTLVLLSDGGLGPEEPAKRALASPCRNSPVELLHVRSSDVPAYVEAGAVDCGVTGEDLVAESGREIVAMLRLDYGTCRLELAVPEEAAARRLDDLRGGRVATAHPRLARRTLRERGVEMDVVPLRGAVEIAPRLGVADAVADLVSSGDTMRRNRLRPLETLFESQAVLVAPREPSAGARRLAALLDAVVRGRAQRVVAFRAPNGSLPALPSLGRALRTAPARDGGVFVEAVVPAALLWTFVAELERIGAADVAIAPAANAGSR
jgi:ATP phosphoribosyltransferase